VALYALAMGLGAPLLLVGTLGGQVLPRAGVWMNRVKAGFGVVMLALAVYLAAPFLPGWLPLLLWAAIALGCALALWRLQRWPARLLAGAASTLAVLWLIGAATGAYQPLRPLAALGGQPAHRAFPPFTRIADSAELDTRLAQSRQPVLLDFYADWCVACKEMEADTFPDPAVSTQLQRFTRLQADVTANRAEHQALLKRFGLYGPPGILILAPDGRELQRVVGFVPPAEFARLLADVRLP
jgi:thiol:disulfide interchange protein DsbD